MLQWECSSLLSEEFDEDEMFEDAQVQQTEDPYAWAKAKEVPNIPANQPQQNQEQTTWETPAQQQVQQQQVQQQPVQQQVQQTTSQHPVDLGRREKSMGSRPKLRQ